MLITRHLDFSLPYRALFARRGLPDLRTGCSTHSPSCSCASTSAGFFWGDCSLSNTLFRRTPGALAAYLVDAETGELHARLFDQFEQHVRAICGWTLGDGARHSDAEMVNLIGDEVGAAPEIAGGRVHLYGKAEARPGRKMGHVTRIAPRTP